MIKLIEIIIGILILIVGLYIISPDRDLDNEIILESTIESGTHDLEYWKSEDEDGDIVWIRFRVLQNNTKLWVLDKYGTIVHETPMEFDPYDDGRDRIHKHRWKLYYTEWTQDIYPGMYQIVVGSYLINTTNLTVDIEI